MNKAITVIGIGDDGCRSLSSRAINAVSQCQLLIGGQRQLEFFPEFDGGKSFSTRESAKFWTDFRIYQPNRMSVYWHLAIRCFLVLAG